MGTEEELRAVIREAKGLCLAEAALAQPVQIQTLLAINGDVVDADVAGEAGMLGHAHPTAE